MAKLIKVTTPNFVFIECLMTVLSVKIIELRLLSYVTGEKVCMKHWWKYTDGKIEGKR
jgi:hypothetical protein